MIKLASPHRQGQLLVLCAGLCFGFLGFFGAKAQQADVKIADLLGLRFLLAGVIMGLISLIVHPNAWRTWPKTQILLALGLGAGGYAVFSMFYFTSLRGLSSSLAVLLLYTYPLFVLILGYFLLNERPHNKQLLSLPLALGGLVMIFWGEIRVESLSAFSFGLGSGFLYALYILLSRKYLRTEWLGPALSVIQMSAGAALLLASELQGGAQIVLTLKLAWLPVLGLTLVCSLLAMGLFQLGLSRLPAWEASLIGMSEPLAAMWIGTLLLNETLSPRQWLGGSLALAGLALLAWASSPSSQRPG
jgi:drug/metabolite transporter (DMT)-like permease